MFIEVKPVIDKSMRKLCLSPYYGHSRGCPNFNKKTGCPPQLPTIDHLIDLDNKMPMYAIFNKFDFKAHCDRMRKKHPEWSQRQVECCLYWQGTARKSLREKIGVFRQAHPRLYIVAYPEASGTNLTATIKQIGISLEWPPKRHTYQVVLAGSKR